jgi:G:T/U-mismatch repair DNA glycosylase
MLPEIWAQNLRVVFVGTTVTETSDQLGFYYLGPNNRFWSLLEYAGITPTALVSPQDRKVLVNAMKDGVLSEMYQKLFFEKREAELLQHHIGLTDLNRRKVVSNDDDPSAQPTIEDVQKFIKKVEKFKPKIVAFVASMEIVEKCLKPLYPAVTQQRGKQDFLIGTSEVWFLGSTSGRVKDTEALEQVFEDLAERLSKE